MQFKTPEEFHNRLGFIFHAILAVPLAVFVYLFLEIKNRGMEPNLQNGQEAWLLIGSITIISFVMVFLSYRHFRKGLRSVHQLSSLKEKLPPYFTHLLKFYAVIEGSSLLMILGLYLTTSSVFIVGYMFLLLVLSLNRPTPQKYVKDLNLTKEESDIVLLKKDFPLNEQ
ncbi:MAG: hypothetical protein ABJH05_10245 [Fulvivirga sp.]